MSTGPASTAQQDEKCEYRARGAGVRSTEPRAGLIKYGCANVWHEGLLAQETKADLLIMDDNAAKKTAKYLGFPVTGTMGILLRAKREGLITEVKPLMEGLIEDGLFVSPTVQIYVLEQAGEK